MAVFPSYYYYYCEKNGKQWLSISGAFGQPEQPKATENKTKTVLDS